MIQFGYERIQFGPDEPVRWWFFIHVANARPQAPRRGVTDPGFFFARGGFVATEDDAIDELDQAKDQARHEWARWIHQASHLLGADGRLIPLDRPLAEILAEHQTSELAQLAAELDEVMGPRPPRPLAELT